MPDIFTQKKRLQREVARLQEDLKPKATLGEIFAAVGRGFDRLLIELAVHIPVGVAIGISAYGYQQYDAFAWGLIPLTCAMSVLLSRTYGLIQKAKDLDAIIFLVAIGAGAFTMEAYGVHLGATRFNIQNAAEHKQTFDDSILILAAVFFGVVNVFSRRAYILAFEKLGADMLAPESYWRNRRRRDRFTETLERTEARESFRTKGDGSKLTDEHAVLCFHRNGAWPLGYKPTEDMLAKMGGPITKAHLAAGVRA